MARRKNKKAQPKVEPKVVTPPILDTSKLDGELRSRGVAVNGPSAHLMVYYYNVYINGRLALSPWQQIQDGDVIEVYEWDEREEEYLKNEWTVGSEELIVMYRNCPKPHVDSLFGRGGHPELVKPHHTF